MRVEDQLFAHARTQPDKLAVIAGDKRLSYGAFAAAVASLAAALAQAGVGRGDRVLVFMENRAEAAIAIYGVLAAGAEPLVPPEAANLALLQQRFFQLILGDLPLLEQDQTQGQFDFVHGGAWSL